MNAARAAYALARKDVRLLRPVIVTAAVVMALAYLVFPPVAGSVRVRVLAIADVDALLRSSPMVRANVLVWLALLPVVAAVGGLGTALERRERWAELTATLPLRRGFAVAVKLTVFVSAFLLLAGLNLGILYLRTRLEGVGVPWRPFAIALLNQRWELIVAMIVVILGGGALVEVVLRRRPARVRLAVGAGLLLAFVSGVVFSLNLILQESLYIRFRPPPWVLTSALDRLSVPYVPVAVSLFGVAWLASSVTRSPTIAAAVALGLVGGVFSVWPGAFWVIDQSSSADQAAVARNLMSMTVAGLACVAAGTVLAVRRTSP